MPESFDVDGEIERAATPPAAAYRDAELHTRVVERAFAGGWQVLDGSGPAPGHAQPLVLLEGALDEPLVWTRAADGAASLVSNVCTHRGYLVCREAGPARELRCGYHGRAFRLDGRLATAPGFEGAVDFPRPEDDLTALPLEELGPLRFTRLRPAADFARWIEPARDRFGWWGWQRLQPDPSGTTSYDVGASWALYVENYLEGFHIPWVHPTLRATIVGSSYRTELAAHGVVQLADAPDGVPAIEPPPGSVDHGVRLAGIYLWLFPNTMLNLYPWGLSLNRVVPLGVERCRVEYRRYLLDATLLDEGAGGDLGRVELEDQRVVEGVARGLRSRLYRRGRYAPAHERGTHHFHRLLHAAVG